MFYFFILTLLILMVISTARITCPSYTSPKYYPTWDSAPDFHVFSFVLEGSKHNSINEHSGNKRILQWTIKKNDCFRVKIEVFQFSTFFFILFKTSLHFCAWENLFLSTFLLIFHQISHNLWNFKVFKVFFFFNISEK